MKMLRLIAPMALAGLLVGAAGAPAQAQTLLDHGHVDVFDIDYLAGSDSLDVNVRANADTGAPGLYHPSSVDIEVARSFTVPASWNICATGTAWVLPQQQVSGFVWAGWNTDGVHAGDVPGDQVTVNLVSVDNLSGGSDAFCLYTASGGAVSHVYLDTDSGPSSFAVPAEDHAHANWTFDEPGTYEVTVNVTATGTNPSGNHTFTFVVG